MASSGGSAKNSKSKSSAAQARSEASKKAAATRKRNAEMSKAQDPAREASRAEERRQTREQAQVGDARQRGEVQLEQGQPRPRKSPGGKAAEKRSKAQVTLRGRFEPGQRVRLYKVRGPEQLGVGIGDELVCVKRVDENRTVQFTAADGVELGERYIAVSHAGGHIRQARVTGKKADEPQGTLTQPPVGYDDVRHGDGVIAGERGQPKKPGPERVPDFPPEG